MQILLTRPSRDAAHLAQALRRDGFEVHLEPLLEISFIDDPVPDLARYQAVLLTSANGARALARATRRRDLALVAVGPATAGEARDLGFQHVEVAAGDVAALADQVTRSLNPEAGPLLHVAGSVTAGDLKGELEAAGFKIDRAVLYHSTPVRLLSDATRRLLAGGRIDAVLLFSPRTAKTLVQLAQAAGLEGAFTGVSAFCLSPAVGHAAEALTWKNIVVAAHSSEAELLNLLKSQSLNDYSIDGSNAR